jgi:hypothetical protein
MFHFAPPLFYMGRHCEVSVWHVCVANKKLVPLLQLVLLLQISYITGRCRDVWITNCRGCVRKRPWPERGTLPAFVWNSKGHTKNFSQEWLSQGLRRIRNITNSKQTVLPPQPWRSVKPSYSDTWVMYCHHYIWHISFVTFCQLNYSINLAPKVVCPYRRRYRGGK